MTQEDKSLEYVLSATATFPPAILFALIAGFIAYAYNPHLGSRILLSIPFILIGYSMFVIPIANLVGMHKLNAIGAIIYALLIALYITIVAVLIMFYNVQWMVLYTTLGFAGVIVASGFAYILLDKEQDQPCGLEYS